MKVIHRAAVIALFACTVSGQTAPAAAGFEVASIKPSDPVGGGSQIGITPGGVFTAKNVTLKALISQAWEVRDFQISGGPGWLDAEKYDIVAKGGASGVSEDEIRKMTEDQRNAFKARFQLRVQSLLSDRFQLKVHRETKELPVYVLVVGKNGVKFQPSSAGGPGSGLSMRRGAAGAEVEGKGTSIASLVKLLSNQVGRTVIDQTGLKGDYDFKMSFSPDMSPPVGDSAVAEATGASIFTAVQEQLGLKLESQRGPVEVLVIDGVQKPSAN